MFDRCRTQRFAVAKISCLHFIHYFFIIFFIILFSLTFHSLKMFPASSNTSSTSNSTGELVNLVSDYKESKQKYYQNQKVKTSTQDLRNTCLNTSIKCTYNSIEDTYNKRKEEMNGIVDNLSYFKQTGQSIITNFSNSCDDILNNVKQLNNDVGNVY